MRPSALSSSLLLATLAFASAAHGEPTRITVTSADPEVAAACPTEPELIARTDALLGDRVRTGGVRIEVRFERQASGFSAEIVLSGERSGRRVLSDDSPECEELSRSVALALAIALDPSFVPTDSEPAAEPVQPPVDPPQPVAAPTPALREPQPAARRRSTTPASVVSLGAWLGAGASSWQTRPLTLAAGAGISVELFDAFALRPGVLYVPPSSVELEPGSVELELFAVSLDVCARARLTTTISIWPCLGPALGRITARSSGYLDNGSATRSWSALVVRALAEARISSTWGVFLDVAAYFPERRQAFEIGGVGSVKPMKTPGFSLLLGPSVRLW
jgi:hypothetical protein